MRNPSATMASTLSFTAPVLAGRFRLLRQLGAGGMGEVWVAEQLSTGLEVAVKLLPRELAGDPDAAARFELEARTLCRVKHPHVVRVIDFGQDPIRGWFLATELLQGETLAARLAREPVLGPAQVVRLGVEILEGLAGVHAAGIVHRDLKPENVMLVGGEDGAVSVRLLDFGIAKLLEPGHRVDLTVAGGIFGTPAYLSPEQALGRPVDARSDLYACGVLLYQALAGRLPFDGATPAAVAFQHANERPAPLPETVPAVLRVVVEGALEKEPANRFQSAEEMRQALLAAWPESEPMPVREPAPAPARAPIPTPLPRIRGGVSRTVLAVRLAQPASFVWVPPERMGDARPLRLTPPLIARDVVESFGGKLAWISNDGLLADFASPTDTLQCAAALHDRLAELGPIHGFAVDVRAAAAAGEVVRTGRALHGEAVAQAELLVQAAAPGEIVFTHGVYLAMTRSEVACDAWPGRDPGVGQKLYRVLPPEGAPRQELPFGGSTLDRATGFTARRVAMDVGRMAGAGAQLAIRAGMALPPAVRKAAAPALDRARRVPLLAIALLALLAIGGAGAVFLALRGPAVSAEKALERGDLDEARRIAEAWLAEDPKDAEAQAYKARALALAGHLDEAQATFGRALAAEPALARVEGVARALVRTLDRKDADRSLVLAHRTAAVDRALLDATRSIRYWERWNAVRTLERLGLGDRIDWVSVYLLDLQHAGSCGTRVRAARQLAKLGDPRAIDVLLRVRGTRMPEWACNLDSAIDEAVAQLRKTAL